MIFSRVRLFFHSGTLQGAAGRLKGETLAVKDVSRYTSFMEEEHPRLSIKRISAMLWPSVRPQKRWGYFFVVSALAASGLTIAEPLIYGHIVDLLIRSLQARLSFSSAWQGILPLLFFWIGVVIGHTVLNMGSSLARWYVNNEVASHFTEELHRRILGLDLRRFHELHSGEILRRFDNAWDGCWQICERLLRDYLAALLLVLTAVGVGLWLDWRLTIVALLPIPVILGIGWFNLRYTSPAQQRVHKVYEKVSGLAGDAYANIATMKAFVGEGRSVKTIAGRLRFACREQFRINRYWAMAEAVDGGVYTTGRLAIFFFGAWFVLHGTMTVGTLITFLGILSFLFGAVQQIAMSLMETSRSLVRLQRATDFWFEVPAIKDAPNATVVRRMDGDVVFDHVFYGYGDGSTVLRDISFRVPPGQTFALIGESGAGKSTLAQLMLRFHDAARGSVKIDGRDIRTYALASLRKQIGFVMQENVLFHDSILNNIRFAKPNASRKEIVAAAKTAQADAFISALRNGYDTVVGERGIKLSGGEKQRIALARVFLADPPILVLDEATSALDSKTEHALQEALAKVMENRTTLVIAHRLSTVMRANQILVMDHGRLVDRGTHDKLLAHDGPYRRYWQIQAGGYV